MFSKDKATLVSCFPHTFQISLINQNETERLASETKQAERNYQFRENIKQKHVKG